MLRGRFSCVADLATQLPAQSRTVVAIDPRARWDEQAYLLALIADNLSYLRYEQAGGKGRKPKQVERPKPKPKEAEKKSFNVSKSRVHSLLFDSRGGER